MLFLKFSGSATSVKLAEPEFAAEKMNLQLNFAACCKLQLSLQEWFCQ